MKIRSNNGNKLTIYVKKDREKEMREVLDFVGRLKKRGIIASESDLIIRMIMDRYDEIEKSGGFE